MTALINFAEALDRRLKAEGRDAALEARADLAFGLTETDIVDAKYAALLVDMDRMMKSVEVLTEARDEARQAARELRQKLDRHTVQTSTYRLGRWLEGVSEAIGLAATHLRRRV